MAKKISDLTATTLQVGDQVEIYRPSAPTSDLRALLDIAAANGQALTYDLAGGDATIDIDRPLLILTGVGAGALNLVLNAPAQIGHVLTVVAIGATFGGTVSLGSPEPDTIVGSVRSDAVYVLWWDGLDWLRLGTYYRNAFEQLLTWTTARVATDVANANKQPAYDGSGVPVLVPVSGANEAVDRTLGTTGTQLLLPDAPKIDYTTLTQGAGNLTLAKGTGAFGGSYHVLPLIPNPSFTVSLGAGMQMASGSLSLVPSVVNWIVFEYREALDVFLVSSLGVTAGEVAATPHAEIAGTTVQAQLQEIWAERAIPKRSSITSGSCAAHVNGQQIWATGNLTAFPVTADHWSKIFNTTAGNITIASASGSFYKNDGTTQASPLTLGAKRRVVLQGDGTNVYADGL